MAGNPAGDAEAHADEIARLREAEADALAELELARHAADEAQHAAHEARALAEQHRQRAACAEEQCQDLQSQV